MSLASLYTAGWQELKKIGSIVHTFVAKEQPVIQAVGTEIAAAVTVVNPTLGAVVTSFDTLEEVIVGKLLSLASDTSNATTLSALLGDAWPIVQSLTATIKSSPSVLVGAVKAA